MNKNAGASREDAIKALEDGGKLKKKTINSSGSQ